MNSRSPRPTLRWLVILALAHFFADATRAQVTLVWNSGDVVTAIGTTTVATGNTLTIGTVADHDFNARAVVNNGTVNWTGGRLRSGTGGSFTNNSVFNDSASSAHNNDYGGTVATFLNAAGATYNKTGSGTTTFSIPLTQSGTLSIQAGTLSINHAGTFAAGSTTTIASGATLKFAANTSVADAATISGAGLTSLTADTLTLTGTFGAAGGFAQSGGTLAGTYTFATSVSWTAGNWNATGTTTIAAGSTLTISGTADHDFNGRAIVIAGTANWSQGRLRSGSAGSLTIASGGTFNDSNAAATAFNNDYSGTLATLTNAGTFNKTGAGTTSVDLGFSNTGTLSITGGTLKIDRPSSFAAGGPVAVGSGATLQFNDNTTVADAAVFSGAGAFSLTSGTLTLTGTFGAAGGFAQSGGTLAGTHTFDAPVTWTAGNWNSSGTTTLATGRTLAISGTADHDFDGRAIVINGTVNWSQGRLRSGHGGSFTIASGGALNDSHAGATAFNNDYGGTTSTIVNSGTYTKSGAGTTTVQLPFTSSGTLAVNAGTLTLNGGGSLAAGSTATVASGATLSIDSGSFSVPSAAVLSGAGAFSLNGGTLTLGGTLTAPAFTHAGGTLLGDFTLAGTSTWTSGNWNTSTASSAIVATGGTLTVGSTNVHDFDRRTITNNGTLNWTAGQLRTGNAGALVNNGTLNDSAGSSINNVYGGTAGTFTNAGTYHKTGTGTTTLDLAFTNSGTLNVNAGTLAIDAGGTNQAGATLNVASGATLAITGGTFTLVNPANLSGASGSYAVSNGTWSIGTGTLTLPNLALSGGTVSGAGTLAVANLNQTGGTVTTNLNLTGASTWSSGSWNTTTPTTATIASGATLTLATTNVHDFNFRTITNQGTINWQGGQFRTGNGGNLVNAAGAVINDSASSSLNNALGGTAGLFTNAGTFNKTAAGTTTLDLPFANTGTINVSAGTLALDADGTNQSGAALTLATGTTLAITSGTFTLANPANLSGSGATYLVNGGTWSIGAGTLGLPNLTITSGTVTGAVALTTSAFTQSGGTMLANFTLAGPATWSSGNWNTTSSSTATIASGATLSLTTTNVHDFNFRTVTNQGTLDWQAGQLRTGNGGALVNATGAIINDSAGSFFNAAYGNGGSLANAGTYNKSGTGTSSIQTTFANTGIVNVTAGRLSLDGGGSLAAGSAINVAAGATLEFGGGTLTVAAASNLAFAAGSSAIVSAGTTTLASGGFSPPALNLTGGTFTASDAAATSTIPALTISGGTITTAGTLVAPALTQTGGSLGAAALSLTGNSSWTAGNWSTAAASTATVASGVTLTLSGANVKDFDFRTITNQGTVNWTEGQLRSGHGGGIVNAAGATFNNSAASFFNGAYGGGASFANAGTFNKTGAGTSTFQSPLDNTGTVNLNAGRLALDNGGSGSASSVINVASGTTLDFGGGTFTLASGASLASAGTITLSGGTLAVGSGSVSVPSLSITNGTLGGAGTAVIPVFTQTAGNVAISNLSLTGSVSWTGGTWNSAAASTASIASGVTLALASTNHHDFDYRAVTNQGTVNWSAGYIRSGHGGSLTNAAGATFNDTQTAGYSFHAGFGGAFTITNAGTYHRNATGTTYFDSPFNNTGTVNLSQGDLQLRQGGTMAASSIVNAAAGANLYFTNDYTILDGALFQGAGNFQQTGGTLAINGVLKAPVFNWSAGDWNATAATAASAVTTIGAGTTLNLLTTSSKDLDYRTVTNQGTVNWSSGYIRGGHGATFTNATGATFNDQNAAGYTVHPAYGGAFTFTNHGTYNRNVGGTTYFDTTFNNHGTINLAQGAIHLRAGGTMSASGSVNTGAGANFFFTDDYTITNGASLLGAGNYWLTGGTTTVTGNINVGTFNQTAGTLHGNNTLSGVFNWSAGIWNAGATGFTTTIASGASVNLNGGGNKDLDYRAVVNHGTVTWNQGYIRGGHGSTFTNAGTFHDANASGYTVHAAYGGAFSFSNTGTYNRNVAGTTYFDVPFHNSGTLNLSQGDLQLRQGGTMSATSLVNAATGTNLYFTDDYTLLTGARFVGPGNFTQTGGTLTIDGTLKATAFNWSGGNWNATAATAATATTTIDSTTVLNLVSGNSKDLDYRTILNQGTINWSLGYLRGGHGSAITNAAGATFNDLNASSYTLHAAYGGIFNFNNAGTYVRNVAGTTFFDIPFNNTGTLNLTQGDIQLRGGGTMGATGVVNAAAGTNLYFTNDHTLVAGSQLLGAGNIMQTGGTLSFTNLKATAFKWSSGNWNGPGTSTIDPGTVVTLVSGADKDFDARTVVNQGTVNWQAGYLRSGHSGTFTNAAGGVFNDQNASGYTVHAAYGGAFSFNNAGTYNRAVGNTTAFDVPFNNNGTVNLSQGELRLRQGGTMGATSVVHTSTGALFNIASDYTLLAGAQFLGAGTVQHTAGTLLFDQLRATTFTWTGGDWNGAGTSSIASGTTLVLAGGNNKDLNQRTVINNGVVQWQAGYLRAGQGATFTNAAGATFNDQNTSGYTIHNPYGGTFSFHNAGTYLKSTAGTTVISVPFTNSGTINIQAGAIDFAGGFTNANGSILASGGNLSFPAGLNLGSGTLGGTGTITASNVTAGGLVSPGSSPGALTVAGNLTLLSTSTLLFELGGNHQGVNYDWLNVTGSAALDGSLRLVLLAGGTTAIQPSDTLTVMSFGSRTGQFFNVPINGQRFNAFDPAGAFQGSFQVNFTASAVTITNFVPIPEPSTYALLALGLGAVALVSRRAAQRAARRRE